MTSKDLRKKEKQFRQNKGSEKVEIASFVLSIMALIAFTAWVIELILLPCLWKLEETAKKIKSRRKPQDIGKQMIDIVKKVIGQ